VNQTSHQMDLPGHKCSSFRHVWGPDPDLTFDEIARIAALPKSLRGKNEIAARLQRLRHKSFVEKGWLRPHPEWLSKEDLQLIYGLLSEDEKEQFMLVNSEAFPTYPLRDKRKKP